MKAILKNKRVRIVLIVVVVLVVVGAVAGKGTNSSSTTTHAQIENTQSQIENLEGKSLIEALEILDSAGIDYKVQNSNGYDYTEELKTWDTEMKDGWVIKSSKKDSFSNSYILSITTQEAIAAEQMKKTLESKLDVGAALTAVEQYGKREYPYGFEIVDIILGNNVDQALDENTWLLKYSCEVINAFGATAKMTCEAKVTGTSDSPQVTEFAVY